MNCLASLPPFLLGLILAFDDLSTEWIKLYCAGDARLCPRVLKGVRQVRVQAYKPTCNVRLPLLLANLPSLESLAIESNHTLFLESSASWNLLRSLSPTLSTLQIHVDEDSMLTHIANPNGGFALRADTNWIRENVFEPFLVMITPRTNLKVLAFVSSLELDEGDAKRIPPHVNSFSGRFKNEKKPLKAVFDALPRNLEQLTVFAPHAPPACYDSLPPNLTSLTLPGNSGVKTYLNIPLPRTLTHLSGFTFREVSMQVATNYLSRDFVSLTAIDFAAEPLEALNALFPQLRHLSIQNPSIQPSMLRKLPASLVSLTAHITYEKDNDAIVLGDWPPHLTELRDLSRRIVDTSVFPRGLTLLEREIDELDCNGVSDLPRSLKRLTCQLYGLRGPQGEIVGKGEVDYENPDDDFKEELEFPPSLTYLQCVTENIAYTKFPFRLLPPFLVELWLVETVATFSQLLHLPPLLRVLHLQGIARDEGFDIESVEVWERAQYMARMGAREGKVRAEDSAFLGLVTRSKVTLEDILPRTLEQRSRTKMEAMIKRDWRE